jgi:hypothetical protein
MLGNLSSKNLSSGLVKITNNFSQSGTTFKEVPYGQAVGTVVTPSFQVAATQSVDVMGITMQQAGNVRTVVNSGTLENVPEIPVASSVNGSAVFAYTKLFVAACADKCQVDRNNAAQPNRLCTMNFGEPVSSTTNTAAWDKSIKDMAALFWGRTEVTATELATLKTLRDEVAAASLVKTPGNNGNANLSAFYAVCSTMQLAPASLTQ